MMWFRLLLFIPALTAGNALASANDPAPAGRNPAGAVYISIIIDDLGYNLSEGRRAIRLPGPIACAILPHAPFSIRLANQAHRSNKEVLLHLPMESATGKDPGPGHLDAGMHDLSLQFMLTYDLETVPHAIGINNHMGSLLTRDERVMQILMKEIRRRGDLFFVDSLTTNESLAGKIAATHGVPNLSRDVFLDNSRQPADIEHQFEKLLQIARTHGTALAIGHPYTQTLGMLERRLPGLMHKGIHLIPLSHMISLHHSKEALIWQPSLSPWPRAVRNSRP